MRLSDVKSWAHSKMGISLEDKEMFAGQVVQSCSARLSPLFHPSTPSHSHSSRSNFPFPSLTENEMKSPANNTSLVGDWEGRQTEKTQDWDWYFSARGAELFAHSFCNGRTLSCGPANRNPTHVKFTQASSGLQMYYVDKITKKLNRKFTFYKNTATVLLNIRYVFGKFSNEREHLKGKFIGI